MAEDAVQSRLVDVSTDMSLSSLRARVSEFSDSHCAWLTKEDFQREIGKISEWIEEQEKSPKSKSIEKGVQNVCKIATSTANAIQKMKSGEVSDIVSGSMDIISSVVTCARPAVGGPVGAAVGTITGTICNIIGAIFTANKDKQPSVVEQLAKVVHQALIEFNKKLQDQKYNGLVARVTEQKNQMRMMERGDDLADADLWRDYGQFLGELSSRFESPLPFKYEENLTRDPDVADFVKAVETYCKVYNCLMALLISAKGRFSHLEEGRWRFPFLTYKGLDYMKKVDLKISSQVEASKAKLAFLSNQKYLTFLGRLPCEGGKLTKLVALSRNSEARNKLEMVTGSLGLPRLPDLETVESSAKRVSGMSVKVPNVSESDRVSGFHVTFINKTNFPMKIVCGAVAFPDKHPLKFTEVVQPDSSVISSITKTFDFWSLASGLFPTAGYILLYLDGEVRSDDNPRSTDETRVIEFACSLDPKINIEDKTGSEFTKGKDTYDKMQDTGNKKTIYWSTNDTHYMACGEMLPMSMDFMWRFIVQQYDLTDLIPSCQQLKHV